MFSATTGWMTKPKPGVQLNPFHPLSKGLVGYWLMNEGAGSLINDISGNKNHGRLTNMLPNVQGSGWGGSKFGGCLQFNGSDNYVDCGNPPVLKITSNLTYSCWIRFTASQSDSVLMNYLTDWSPWDGAVLGISGTNANKIKWHGDDYTKAAESTTVLNDGVWHHIVGTYDGDKLRIYIDGDYDAISPSDTISYYADSKFNIGAWGHGGDPPVGRDFFGGDIDFVRIYNRSLPSYEIKQLSLNPFCDLIRAPLWYNPTVAGLSIPVAMYNYRRGVVA